MPRPTLQSPLGRSQRSHLASIGYDTRNLPNPFQDTSSSSTSSSIRPSAPVASDTVATSASSSSLKPASRSTLIPSVLLHRQNSNSNNSTSSSNVQSSASRTLARLQSESTPHRGRTGDQQRRQDSDNHDHNHEQEQQHEQEQHEQEQENPLIHLTPSQREAAVENLEIETMDRMQKLRASIGVLTNSLRFRSDAEINRLPSAVRTMTVEEYWFTYNGSAKEYLAQQATKKSVADTSFLQALGMTDHKKKREGQPEELWQHKSKDEDGVERPGQHSARYRPYPNTSSSTLTGTSQQQRIAKKPFVDSRGLGMKKE
ncbi:hypothetical protein EDD11_007511 [Mortierella claussenii]|nr:hypothetical protein EDD11_007511 [Mortierella claussenii]